MIRIWGGWKEKKCKKEKKGVTEERESENWRLEGDWRGEHGGTASGHSCLLPHIDAYGA